MVIAQFLLSALAGGLVCGILAWRMGARRRAMEFSRLQEDLNAKSAAARLLCRQQEAALASCEERAEWLEQENLSLQAEISRQAAAIDQLQSDHGAFSQQKAQWLSMTREMADQALRLKNLAATFERWHEQMNLLMAQNRDMHAKNQELSAIVKHVVIVSLNASIEASRAGTAGRGFAVVAGEVRGLANRSEELSREYSVSLHRNDLTTTMAFQDIQAGGKMIMASLSSIEACANQLSARLEQANS